MPHRPPRKSRKSPPSWGGWVCGSGNHLLLVSHLFELLSPVAQSRGLLRKGEPGGPPTYGSSQRTEGGMGRRGASADTLPDSLPLSWHSYR